MIKKEWQRLIHNPLLIIVLAAIILIPSIYAGLFLASMWDPYGELDKLPVAVVNKDVPVVYEGETINIGEELVKNLQEDGSLDFHFVGDTEAHEGLKNGNYYMVITIPEDFSHNATTVLDDNPSKMDLMYETDPATNYVAMKLSESAMTKIELSLERKVTETYAETLFGKLDTLSASLNDASDGASAILDGENALKDGADTLSDGTGTLLTGAETLSTGADTLKDGAKDLDDGLITYMDGTTALDNGSKDLLTGADALSSGSKTVSDGATALSDGAKDLSDGADKINEGANDLSDGVSSLKDGASSLSSGASTLADGASTVASGASDLNDGLDTLNTSMPLISSALSTLDTGSSDLCTGIETYTEAVDTVASSASDLSSGLGTLDTALSGENGLKDSSAAFKTNLDALSTNASGLAEAGMIPQELADNINALSEGYAQIDTAIGGENGLCNSVTTLSTGSGLISGGLDAIVGEDNSNSAALRDGASSVASGIAALDTSASDLSTGVSTLAQGASDLKDGTSALSTGATSLSEGASTLKAGAETAATGASALASGTSDLASGASTLSSGASTLADGTAALSAGASDLASGAKTLSAGADTLVSNNETILNGSSALKDGAKDLADGAASLKDGASALDEGASTISDSMPDLIDGTSTLYNGLSEGATKLTDTNKAEVNAQMFSNPLETTETRITRVNDNGHAMAAYMMSVGLWVACLAFCLMYPLTEHDKIESGFKWWLSKASVLYPMAVIQAVVLVLVLHFTLGFNPARLAQTILVACLASVAFMSIMYFFNVLLGKVGSFLMLIFMVLQLAGSAGTYPIEVSGPLAAALNRFMPFTYTVGAFRSSIGGGEPFTASVKILLMIFLISTLMTIILFVIRGRKEQKGKTDLHKVMEAHGFA